MSRKKWSETKSGDARRSREKTVANTRLLVEQMAMLKRPISMVAGFQLSSFWGEKEDDVYGFIEEINRVKRTNNQTYDELLPGFVASLEGRAKHAFSMAVKHRCERDDEARKRTIPEATKVALETTIAEATARVEDCRTILNAQFKKLSMATKAAARARQSWSTGEGEDVAEVKGELQAHEEVAQDCVNFIDRLEAEILELEATVRSSQLQLNPVFDDGSAGVLKHQSAELRAFPNQEGLELWLVRTFGRKKTRDQAFSAYLGRRQQVGEPVEDFGFELL